MFCCKSKNDQIISELYSLIDKNFLSVLIIQFPENCGKFVCEIYWTLTASAMDPVWWNSSVLNRSYVRLPETSDQTTDYLCFAVGEGITLSWNHLCVG